MCVKKKHLAFIGREDYLRNRPKAEGSMDFLDISFVPVFTRTTPGEKSSKKPPSRGLTSPYSLDIVKR